MRTNSGGYRRGHLRALAQRGEVDAKEVRIMGSKSVLLPPLVNHILAKTAAKLSKWGGCRPRTRAGPSNYRSVWSPRK
jgi:hypothetical protein